MEIPDPLPLRCIDTQAEVSQVDGCDCGGLDWHRAGCAIWGVPVPVRLAAVNAALAREQAFTDALNARLGEVMRT